MKMDWTSDEWPDWADVGKRVEIELADGRVVAGCLTAEEFFTGEDEVPVFAVVDEAGAEHSFAEHVRWRFVGE